MAISVIVAAASVYDQDPMRMMALFSPGAMAYFSSGAYHPCDPADAVAGASSGDLAAHAAFPGVGIHALRCRSADLGDQVDQVVRVGPVTVPGHATRLSLDEVLLSDGFVFDPDFRLSPLVDAAAARRALDDWTSSLTSPPSSATYPGPATCCQGSRDGRRMRPSPERRARLAPGRLRPGHHQGRLRRCLASRRPGGPVSPRRWWCRGVASGASMPRATP